MDEDMSPSFLAMFSTDLKKMSSGRHNIDSYAIAFLCFSSWGGNSMGLILDARSSITFFESIAYRKAKMMSSEDQDIKL
ncbi:hypothetical protein EYC80_003044 [Monilinia laxa]|uniref:Uncharacterized protein n=1 Tax=Monilinia laxa TaxID=61186 RepID=A0A5N6KCQ6_MONLA|nr:hypothetical protein EYC80_003044 [Monilinia laxa]